MSEIDVLTSLYDSIQTGHKPDVVVGLVTLGAVGADTSAEVGAVTSAEVEADTSAEAGTSGELDVTST